MREAFRLRCLTYNWGKIMRKDFFIADTHFGADTILCYENRPFASVEDMDACMIERWNQCVGQEDTVYVLGDFSAYMDAEKDRELLAKLNGMKILIIGNHDTHRSPEEWRRLGFQECSPWPIIYKDFFMLSHEPLYINTNMPYANIYGHVHGNASYKDVSAQSICISVERIDYRPMEFTELWDKIKSAKGKAVDSAGSRVFIKSDTEMLSRENLFRTP